MTIIDPAPEPEEERSEPWAKNEEHFERDEDNPPIEQPDQQT